MSFQIKSLRKKQTFLYHLLITKIVPVKNKRISDVLIGISVFWWTQHGGILYVRE